MGQQHGFVSMLATREDIDMDIYDQSSPYTPSFDLPSCPESELVTPDTHAQACADEYSGVWHRVIEVETGGLMGARTFGAEMDATFFWHVAPKRHQRDLSQVGLFLEG